MELLESIIILTACLSIGLCGIIITRFRFRTSKHGRQHIKDIQQDLNYMREQKNNEIKELRHETLRLKGIINKGKQGATITENDLDNQAGGLAENLMIKLIPRKYHEVVKPLLPKAETYLMEHQEEIIEKIKGINNKAAQPKTGTIEAATTL